jgi:protein-tyrosine phosphatase
MRETSVRAVVPQEEHGSLVLCGLPGLCMSIDGMPYFDPEHSEQTFEYLSGLQVSLIYFFMEDFELPPEARQMIEETASTHKITVKWIPIVDYGVPSAESEELWKAGRSDRSACLKSGNAIAVTCLYGAGRSGMMAAAITAEVGIETRKAVRFVRQHFVEAVGSLDQERWVAGGSYLT